MTSDPMIQKLEDIAHRTELPYEKRLMETALWFHKNKDRIPREAMAKRVDFLETAVDCLLEMLAMNLERLQGTEGRAASSSLWLPNGMKMNGDGDPRTFR
jgi:hypothetical protein